MWHNKDLSLLKGPERRAKPFNGNGLHISEKCRKGRKTINYQPIQ
jgi:hypothetical protein